MVLHLAGHHRGEEADHQLSIAHQEVRVAAKKKQFHIQEKLVSPLILCPFSRLVHFIHLHVDNAAFASDGADDATERKQR